MTKVLVMKKTILLALIIFSSYAHTAEPLYFKNSQEKEAFCYQLLESGYISAFAEDKCNYHENDLTNTTSLKVLTMMMHANCNIPDSVSEPLRQKINQNGEWQYSELGKTKFCAKYKQHWYKLQQSIDGFIQSPS